MFLQATYAKYLFFLEGTLSNKFGLLLFPIVVGEVLKGLGTLGICSPLQRRKRIKVCQEYLYRVVSYPTEVQGSCVIGLSQDTAAL